MSPSVLAAIPTPIATRFDPQTFVTGAAKRSLDAMTYHHHDSSTAETKTSSSRRSTRSAFDDDDDVFATSHAASSAMQQRPLKRKAISSATTELRQLREEKALLQYELDSLQLKWRRLGVDSDLLACACDAALAKRDARRSDAINKQLKAQLLTQQLFFASVHQMMFYESPLVQLLRAKDAFDGIHASLRLTASSRAATLEQHCASAVQLAPAIMNRFARPHADKASTAVPFAHVGVMGDAAHTFVASVFVCKLRNLSVERVYKAALAYYDALPTEFKQCLGVDLCVSDDADELQSETRDPFTRRSCTQTRYANAASGVRATQRTVLAAALKNDVGVVTSDFVDEDTECEESAAANDAVLTTCSSLVISTALDTHTGERVVLLQRVVVNRYALPATSRRLHDDVAASLPHLNGDLLMAVMCRELQAASSAAASSPAPPAAVAA